MLLLAALIGIAANNATPTSKGGQQYDTRDPPPPHRAIDAHQWAVIAKDPTCTRPSASSCLGG